MNFFFLFLNTIPIFSHHTIPFTLIIEQVDVEPTLKNFVENLIEKYNEIISPESKITFSLSNILYYSDLMELERSATTLKMSNDVDISSDDGYFEENDRYYESDGYYGNMGGDMYKLFPKNKKNKILDDCIGTPNISCRKFFLESLNRNFLWFISSGMVNLNFSKFIEINPCTTRYFGNIYGSQNLFNEVEGGINDWISNLVGSEIILESGEFVDVSKLETDLRKCSYVYKLSSSDSSDDDLIKGSV